ncbi:MAG TPA: hypothetical protein DIV79_16620 [Opitutae bacterium]|nr:hypothetical protein [Opitutaceae bacterium]HCR31629.1 hypothetical protein [Opitutae bacterium]
MKLYSRKEESRRWITTLIIVSIFLWALSGCESTSTGVVEVTGDVRSALTEWDVEVYQDPKGLLPWVPDMEIPVRYDVIAKLESNRASGFNPGAVDNKTTQIVTDLKKQAAKMGANAIIVREVKIFEDVVERQTSGYENVRFPDGSIRQVEVPPRTYYERVLKVNIAADSVYLDWENVWAPAGQIGNGISNTP